MTKNTCKKTVSHDNSQDVKKNLGSEGMADPGPIMIALMLCLTPELQRKKPK